MQLPSLVIVSRVGWRWAVAEAFLVSIVYELRQSPVVNLVKVELGLDRAPNCLLLHSCNDPLKDADLFSRSLPDFLTLTLCNPIIIAAQLSLSLLYSQLLLVVGCTKLSKTLLPQR